MDGLGKGFTVGCVGDILGGAVGDDGCVDGCNVGRRGLEGLAVGAIVGT